MTVPPLTLFLVDEDPVFRTGLRLWLDRRSDFQVVGEAASAAASLQQLTTLQAATVDAGETLATAGVDGVIIGLGDTADVSEPAIGLDLCGQIKQQFPTLSVLVLSRYGEPVVAAAARQMGADGFGPRGLPLPELTRLIRQSLRPAGVSLGPDADIAWPERSQGLIVGLHCNAIQQIEVALAMVKETAARRPNLVYRWVLAGQIRELRAARWMIRQILPLSSPAGRPAENFSITGLRTEQVPESATGDAPLRNPGNSKTNLRAGAQPDSLQQMQPADTIAASSLLSPLAIDSVRTRVCEAVFRKLRFPLDNRSDVPLEIDILRADKRRELLYTVLRAFEAGLDDLQQAEIQPGQLESQRLEFLTDLWRAVTLDFFGRYYTPPIAGLEQPMVMALQQDVGLVQSAILQPIPAVPALLGHLLFQTGLEIEGVTYLATTPDALRRSQFLLENLLIQIACGVMQPLLNRFADVEVLKRSLYQRRIISTRDVTRFRNELSWRYRWDALINEPKAIFESQYRLLALAPGGIQILWIYAPRQQELAALSGFPYVLTLALETRDAIAPRLRTTLAWLGSGVVFVLTELIGRGIGLVGRGVAKGIGNTWQDLRLRQRRDEL